MKQNSLYRPSRKLIIPICVLLSFLFCGRDTSFFRNCLPVGDAAVENLGIFGADRNQSILGQDGCTPVPLRGMTMWTFGDTILGTWKGELSMDSTFEDSAVMKGMISNSLAFSEVPDEKNIRHLKFTFYREKGSVVQFIKNSKNENPKYWRFWAADGIEIDGSVYVYYFKVLIDPAGAIKKNSFLPIRVMGTGIAEWKKPPEWKPGEPVDFKRIATVFFENEPVFGDCIVRSGAHLYIMGHGQPVSGRISAYVARVAVSGIKNRERYEFLDRSGKWSPRLGDACPLLHDVMGELSLSYNSYIGEYIIIYCGMGGSIKLARFKNFAHLLRAESKEMYTPPPLPKIKSRTHLYYYSGKEIFHTGDAIYAVYINPAIYQPILIRIPYGLINQL